MPNEPLVAIVDDDESIRRTTQDLLESAGLPAAAFASAQAFLDSGLQGRTHCVIADMRMPGMSGLALHEQLVASDGGIPTILMSAYADEQVRRRALAAGIAAYLAKPVTAEELLGAVRTVLATPAPGPGPADSPLPAPQARQRRALAKERFR